MGINPQTQKTWNLIHIEFGSNNKFLKTTVLFCFGNKYITNPQLDLEDYEVCSARAPDFIATTNKSYIFILWEYIYFM